MCHLRGREPGMFRRPNVPLRSTYRRRSGGAARTAVHVESAQHRNSQVERQDLLGESSLSWVDKLPEPLREVHEVVMSVSASWQFGIGFAQDNDAEMFAGCAYTVHLWFVDD